MFSKMMSEGARSDEANEGFGYRFDDEKLTLVNQTADTALAYEVNAANCQFSQFKFLPLKYMGNLTIELELATNATDCILNPNDYDESDTGIDATLRNRFTTSVALPAGAATNTSVDWEINNVFCACDVLTLDNNLNDEYVKHLLEGKGLPITYTTYITQSQTVKGLTDISVPVIRSVFQACRCFYHLL